MAGVYNIWGSENYIQLKFKGITDIDEVHAACREWFEKRKFDFHDHFYKAKHPTPVGEEVFWRWTAFRNVTEYLRFQADIEWHFWDWQPIDVVQNGKKKKLYKGRLKVIIKGSLITDYNDRFEKNSFQHALREFFDKYVFLTRLHFWSGHFEYLMHDFYTFLKDKLGFYMKANAYAGVRL